jgi:predicted glycosyltransferase involved in capsule biosynthesis
LYRSSYTIAHSRDGTIYYLNRSQEPAFFSVGEVDRDIEYFSRKFGEQHKLIFNLALLTAERTVINRHDAAQTASSDETLARDTD